MAGGYISYPQPGGGGSGSGTVTSVALSLPSSVFNISGSPVTTAGTLTGSFKTQTANLIFAGPASGAAAVPTFRSMVSLDLPSSPNFLGVSTFPNGSAAAPSIAAAAGPTNGFYFVGASNTLGIATNGVSALSISSGQVVLVPVGLGVGVAGNITSNVIFEVRKDQNGFTTALIENGDAGSSAQAKLQLTSNADDLNIFAQSTATGALAGITANGGFTAGFQISMLGTNPIGFKNNGTTSLTIDGSRRVGIGSSGADASTALLVSTSTTLTGTSQQAVYAFPSFNSSATSRGAGFYSQPGTAASSFTQSALYAYYATIGTIGATSTVTRFYSYGGSAVTSASNNAYMSDNATWSGNVCLHLTQNNPSTIAGIMNLTNATASTSSSTGGLVVSGGLGLAGDLYQTSGKAIVSGTYHIEPLEQDTGNSGTTKTIDLSVASVAKSTLTGSVTYTLTNPGVAGSTYVFRIIQGASSYTVTWPATVKWPAGTAPVITTTSGRMDLISLLWDGTDYYGTFAQNYTP